MTDRNGGRRKIRLEEQILEDIISMDLDSWRENMGNRTERRGL